MQSHIRKVYACLAVTCHLRFWQDDRGLLRATAVTRGWNGYRNKSQHRKLTLEKKILPPPQQGFEPATFRSRVRTSNHWAIPAPRCPLPGACFRIDDFFYSIFLQYVKFWQYHWSTSLNGWRKLQSFTLSLINLLSSLISSSFRSSLLLITSTSPKWLRIASARRRTGASVCRTNKSLLISKLLTTSIYHKTGGVWRQGDVVGGWGGGRGELGPIEPKKNPVRKDKYWNI